MMVTRRTCYHPAVHRTTTTQGRINETIAFFSMDSLLLLSYRPLFSFLVRDFVAFTPRELPSDPSRTFWIIFSTMADDEKPNCGIHDYVSTWKGAVG